MGWNFILPWVSFLYNNVINRSTSESLFWVIYGNSPRNASKLGS